MPDGQSIDSTEHRDFGVAAVGGLVCQNFEAHPNEEIKMQSGAHEGVWCPECGRVAGGGPSSGISFVDEPPTDGQSSDDTDQRWSV
jgi:hypothetical protein